MAWQFKTNFKCPPLAKPTAKSPVIRRIIFNQFSKLYDNINDFTIILDRNYFLRKNTISKFTPVFSGLTFHQYFQRLPLERKEMWMTQNLYIAERRRRWRNTGRGKERHAERGGRGIFMTRGERERRKEGKSKGKNYFGRKNNLFLFY